MNIIEELPEFLAHFVKEVDVLGIDVTKYNLDHPAYYTSSSEVYEKVKKEFEDISTLVAEPIIGGRRVGMFKLNKPIDYKGNHIGALEVIEPVEGQVIESGWEHAEYVINEPYDELMERYSHIDWVTTSMDRDFCPHLKVSLPDGIQLKFHHEDLLDIAENYS